MGRYTGWLKLLCHIGDNVSWCACSGRVIFLQPHRRISEKDGKCLNSAEDKYIVVEPNSML